MGHLLFALLVVGVAQGQQPQPGIKSETDGSVTVTVRDSTGMLNVKRGNSPREPMVTLAQASSMAAAAQSNAYSMAMSATTSMVNSALIAANSTASAQLNATLTNEQNGYVSYPFLAALTNRILFQDAANLTYLRQTNAQSTYATRTIVNAISQVTSTLAMTQAQLINATNQQAVFPTCPALPNPANGMVSSHIEIIPGTTVQYSCNSGYVLRGVATRLCLSNGSYTGIAPICATCPQSWVPVSTGLGDMLNINGGASLWGNRDIRSGNPGQRTSFNFPPVRVTGGLVRFRFSWQFVVGYGSCGFSCTRTGPTMSVWIINAQNSSDQVQAYATSGPLRGYDYDTCNNNWGSPTDPNDGCYSPQMPVNVALNNALPTARSVIVQVRFVNNQRNMHLNDDGMNMAIYTGNC